MNIKLLKLIIVSLSLSCSLSSFGKGLADTFKMGEGSKYKMALEDSGEVIVSLYVVSVMESVLSIEMFFDGQQKMWQRFDLYQNEKDQTQSLEIRKGYFYVPELQKPEILPEKNLGGTGDVLMSDFLLNKQAQFDGLTKGIETVLVPAGKIKAKHLQKTYAEKVIDFWIADEVKPLGVVRLVQKSTKGKISDNFDMQLVSLIKNVSPKIDPDKAVAISSEGKKYLGL